MLTYALKIEQYNVILKNYTKLILNNIFISESFNTSISHQLFDYKITFHNSQLENTKSKGDFVLKKQF